MRRRCSFCKFAGNDKQLNKHIPSHRAIQTSVFAKQMGLSSRDIIDTAIRLGYPEDARTDMIPERIADRKSKNLSKGYYRRRRYCVKCYTEHEGQCGRDPNSGVWAKLQNEKRAPKLSQGGLPSLGKRRP